MQIVLAPQRHRLVAESKELEAWNPLAFDQGQLVHELVLFVLEGEHDGVAGTLPVIMQTFEISLERNAQIAPGVWAHVDQRPPRAEELPCFFQGLG